MSVIWKNKKGKGVTLLNPAEKGRKAAQELKRGYHLTNDGVVTELIGRWTNIRYTITFDVNGGDNDISPMTVEHGTVADYPVPERTGFAFLGWICTNNADFETSFPVTSKSDTRTA